MPGPNTRWLTIPAVPSSGGTSGSSAVSGLTAAVATNSIAWAGNIPQEWSMDTNTDSTIMFAATETTPSTGGTSTSGVPNQVMLRLGTLPTSTMSPLSVYSRGNHVFSVSPTTRQLFLTDGTATAPALAFSADTVYGLYRHTGGNIRIGRSGTDYYDFGLSQHLIPVGTAPTLAGSGSPGLSDITNTTSGLYFTDNQTVGITTNARENAQFVGGGGGGTVDNYLQLTNPRTSAVGYALNVRKSRTTSTIVTGDDLLVLNAAGYDGTRFTTTTSVQFGTEGTISALRVPGFIAFKTATALGTVTEAYRINSSQSMLVGTTTESSTLTVGGGVSFNFTSVSAAYTVTTSTFAVYASAPGATVAVTLPVVSNAKGKVVLVKKTDGGINTVTVGKAGGSGDTIEGAATVTLSTQYSDVLLHNDGLTTWYKVSTL